MEIRAFTIGILSKALAKFIRLKEENMYWMLLYQHLYKQLDENLLDNASKQLQNT